MGNAEMKNIKTDNILFIKATIENISPLHIGDDEDEILIDKDSNMAYLPATSIAGSFSAYLRDAGYDYRLLFGEQNDDTASMSRIFISDSFSEVTGIQRRDGIRINPVTGTALNKSKMNKLYLSEGMQFKLLFEIHCNSNKSNEEKEKFKEMIYKCLKALDRKHITFGAGKSKGLGIFKVIEAEEFDFDLTKIDDLERYLKKDFSISRKIKINNDIKNDNIKNQVSDDAGNSVEMDTGVNLVEFKLSGQLTTPVLIKTSNIFEKRKLDEVNIKSGGHYIIPGSGLKGILRARMRKIAAYYGCENKVDEIFGEYYDDGSNSSDSNSDSISNTSGSGSETETDSEKTKKNKKHVLSRVMVRETIINNDGYNNSTVYNRIKIDKFTGGTIRGALVQEAPVIGNIEAEIVYRKTGKEEFDDFAIGLLLFALRDLATENVNIGSGASIGRGHFKAHEMRVSDDSGNLIKIDFINKKIQGEELLQKYINSVKEYGSVQEVPYE